jgi:catechol 2,3-dioxygenase-like lactoylglutathione lyase family enzyme
MFKSFTGVDHVVIAVRDLDAARDTFQRMGFTVTPRGHHTLGSQNHCVMLGNDYLELLAVPVPHELTRYYRDFLAAGEGPGAAAVATPSADRAYTEWIWAGLSPSRVADLGRPVTTPHGVDEARFRITQLPARATPGLRWFACQHLTREHVWRSEWQAHANGATAIAAIAVVCDPPRLAHAVKASAKALGATPRVVAEGTVLDLGNAALALLDEAGFASRWPDLALPARPHPVAAALFLRADREAAEAALRRGGFRPRRMPDGSVALDADQAHGVALLFG